MGGGALLGPAEDGVLGGVVRLERAAARTGRPLVARQWNVGAEVRAAGALLEVAADGRHVAQLGGGGEQQRLGEDRTLAGDLRVGGEVAHAGQGADAQFACRPDVDAGERQPGDVHEVIGSLDAFFEPVEQLRSTGQQLGSGDAQGGERRVHVRRLDVGELLHGRTPSPVSAPSATSATAAVICG